MTLSKTLVPIPFDGSLNNKIAEKLLPQGQFLDLQNVVRRKTGQYHKRYGFGSLGTNTQDGDTITVGRSVDRFKRDLLLFSDSQCYSYSPSQDYWVERGPISSVSLSSSAVVSNSYQQRYGDIAYLNGIEVCVWADSRGGVRYSVIDTETGAYLVHDVEVDSNAVFPRVVSIAAGFLITYIDSDSKLKARRIAIGTPTEIGSANTLATSVSTSSFYDIQRFNDVALVIYNVMAVGVHVAYATATGEIGSSGANGYPDPVLIDSTTVNSGCIVSDEANLRAFVLTNTGALNCYVYGQDLVQLASDLIASPGVNGNVTATLVDDNTIRVFCEVEYGSDSAKNRITQYVISFDGSSIDAHFGNADVVSVGLVSKAFFVNGMSYILTAHHSTLQSTYFLISEESAIVGKFATSRAAGLNYIAETSTGRRSLSNVVVSSNGEYVAALSVLNRLTTLTSTTASGFIGVDRLAVDFTRTNLDSSELGKNLHVAGGVVHAYDGAKLVEHGFLLYPEGVTGSATTGGSLTTGSTYRIRVVYEWVDGQGQRHQSAPSTSISVATGGSGTKINLTVPSLMLTQKENVKCVAYSTKAGETTVYYRAGEADNDTTAETTTVPITSVSGTAEILYTVGGTLENIAAPSPIALCTHRNRTWVVSAEDGSVWYSRQHVEGEGVAFSDGQKIKFDNGTAIGSLDQRLALFTESSISIMAGEGPTDAGVQNDYLTPEEIYSDVGCIDYRSLVEMPKGIMFKSKKGIYLLDPSLQATYIGAPVEDYNDLTISSAVVIEDDNEVRFTTEDGVCLVYNYFYDQWYTFTNYEAVGAVFGLNSYCHVKADGTVNKETAGRYNDNGRRYSVVLETNWMQFAKLLGFQRIYRWALQGDFISHCHCRVKLAYNGEPVYNETVYFNTETGLGTGVYGDGEYGEAEVYGGTGSQVFEFRSKPARQKCESFKLRIEDIDTISEAGSGSFALTSMAIEVGIKQGIGKMSSNKTRGG